MERLSNLGYLALKKQDGSGAVIPDVFAPLYNEDMSTNLNYDEDNPVAGIKFARYQTLQGQRDHQGSFTIIAEPNTAGYVLDMTFNRSDSSGTSPTTHTFDDASDSSSYTIDIAPENHVYRFVGVKASQITQSFNDNKMHLEVTASALKAFSAAAVDSVSGTGPYTVTLKTDYDPAPTTGLVSGDTVQFYDVSEDTYLDGTIDSIDSDTDLTVSTSTADLTTLEGDDVLTLKPQDISFDTLQPFMRARSEWRFASTAADALTAAHTPLDEASWTLNHNFNNDGGEKRTGSFDPDSLVRLQSNAELTATQFFDKSDETRKYIAKEKQALVIRHFSGDNHELRLTFNDIRMSAGGKPTVETENYLVHNFTFLPNYDDGDGQAFDVKVLNEVASI